MRVKHKETPFTQISNALLNDITLSLKAKGLYAYMYSKPDNWNFTIRSMSSQLREGYEAIQRALKELKEHGWIKYDKKQSGEGVYTILYEPETEKPIMENSQKRETPLSENPIMVKPDRINNKDTNNNKELFNNKEYIVEIIDHLNYVIQRHFKYQTYKKEIMARLNAGFTVDDFKQVHLVKAAQWLKDKDMSKYLNPTTLYNAKKFEKYLNEPLTDQLKAKLVANHSGMTMTQLRDEMIRGASND